MKNLRMFIVKGLVAITMMIGVMSNQGVFAQAPPQGMNFQAVIYSADSVLSNTDLDVDISINDNANGFSETHNTTTDANGLLSITIGSINNTDFENIEWGNGCSITVEVFMGGVSILSKTDNLESVPYALYAERAKTAEVANSVNGIDFNDFATMSDLSNITFDMTILDPYMKISDFDNVVDTLVSVNDLDEFTKRDELIDSLMSINNTLTIMNSSLLDSIAFLRNDLNNMGNSIGYQIGDTYNLPGSGGQKGVIVFIYKKNNQTKALLVDDENSNYGNWDLPTFEQMSILFNNRLFWNSDNTKVYEIDGGSGFNFVNGTYFPSGNNMNVAKVIEVNL
ncbi:MAG: hypothetical protein H3C31_11835 [Brumimicrobium sp.]|nr:hypothetical protein [Brumimicrobium sp.]